MGPSRARIRLPEGELCSDDGAIGHHQGHIVRLAMVVTASSRLLPPALFLHSSQSPDLPLRPSTPLRSGTSCAPCSNKRRLLGETVFVGTDREERDRYDRTLIYLWLENGEFYNRTLLA